MVSMKRWKDLLTQKTDSISTASLILSTAFVVSALLGFWRSRLLYSMLFRCCTAELDAYNAAFRLPDLIFKLVVTGALSASFIPIFTGYLEKGIKEANLMASRVISWLSLIFMAISLVIFIFAPDFSRIIAPGFTPEQIDLMSSLTRILLVAQFFFLLSNFFTGILHVNATFLVPAIAPSIYNLFIIAAIVWLTPSIGIYAAAIGAVIGAMFHMLIQWPIVRRTGFRFMPGIGKHRGVNEVVRLMLPRSLSLGIGEIESTATIFFASGLASGSLSILNLATQLIYLPSRVIGATVGQASLPQFSRHMVKKEFRLLALKLDDLVVKMIFLAVPMIAGVVVLRLPIVRLAFGSREFPWEATLITAKVLGIMAVIIVFQSISAILTRTFYALHDTKTPLWIAMVSLLVNLIVNSYFILFTNLGIVGLSISISLAAVIQSLGLMLVLTRRLPESNLFAWLASGWKIALAGTIAGGLGWILMRQVDHRLIDTTKTLGVVEILVLVGGVILAAYLVLANYLVADITGYFANKALEVGRGFDRFKKN